MSNDEVIESLDADFLRPGRNGTGTKLSLSPGFLLVAFAYSLRVFAALQALG
jgi:hypothetical protein